MIVFKIRAIQIISGKVGHNRVGWWKNKKRKIKEKSYDGKKKTGNLSWKHVNMKDTVKISGKRLSTAG